MTSEAGMKSEWSRSYAVFIYLHHRELCILSACGTLEQSTGVSLAGVSFWIVVAGSMGIKHSGGIRNWADSVTPTVVQILNNSSPTA